jgi:hypothetical protein
VTEAVGPLVLNVEALRNAAATDCSRRFPDEPPLTPADVQITAENVVMVCLRADDGRARWAVLQGPAIDRIGILAFDFTDLLVADE